MTVYDFEPKHTYECKNNILSGITLLPWLKILGPGPPPRGTAPC